MCLGIIKINPNDQNANKYLGMAMMMKGDDHQEEAIHYFDQAMLQGFSDP